jgi:predicted nucleic acid-binding Zn ribbon protein
MNRGKDKPPGARPRPEKRPSPGPGPGNRPEPRPSRDPESRSGRRGMERLGDLLPEAARDLGLEEELELAQAISAWQRVVAERVPAAVGSCRLVGLVQGVATVEADLPIVAQELRLRAPELTAGLRSAVGAPVRQLRVTAGHV